MRQRRYGVLPNPYLELNFTEVAADKTARRQFVRINHAVAGVRRKQVRDPCNSSLRRGYSFAKIWFASSKVSFEPMSNHKPGTVHV
jgi:hypothetical protein